MVNVLTHKGWYQRSSIIWGLCCCALAGCPQTVEPQSDVAPPRVIEILPADPLLPVDGTLEVRFSEALLGQNVTTDSVVIVERSLVDETFIADLDNPPLIDSRQAKVETITVSLAQENTTVKISPVVALKPSTNYALIFSSDVRDESGNPLVGSDGLQAHFRYDFKSDSGPPVMIETDVIRPGMSLVAPNRRRFQIQFDQEVFLESETAIRFESTTTAAKIPQIESLLLDGTGTRLSIYIQEDNSSCERFSPGSQYELIVTSGLVNSGGQAIEETGVAFETGVSCDTSGVMILRQPEILAEESTAQFLVISSRPVNVSIFYGTEISALDCIGNSCPVYGWNNNWTDGAYQSVVQVTDLLVWTTYQYKVIVEDDMGFVAQVSGHFLTEALPKLAINELMPNPAASSETSGEYIEFHNYGVDMIDVAGFEVRLDGGADDGGKTCLLAETSGEWVIAPGDFGILTSSSFDTVNYVGLDESKVRAVEGTWCTLVNSRSQPMALYDERGRKLSSFGGWLTVSSSDEGRSIERLQADAADLEDSFCLSRNDTGPSPASENGISVHGCDE
jgi:hypothetical protein